MEVISSYTRSEALEDGALVEVTETAKEAGVSIPLYLTRSVHERLEPSEDAQQYGQSFDGRLWDVLMVFRAAAANLDDHFTAFDVIIQDGPGERETVELWATIDGPEEPGGTPAITIMFPEDY